MGHILKDSCDTSQEFPTQFEEGPYILALLILISNPSNKSTYFWNQMGKQCRHLSDNYKHMVRFGNSVLPRLIHHTFLIGNK